MQNCIGAIDGTHIPITISQDKAPPYRNRKGTLSQNVMLACNFDLNFTFIPFGWEGSASDARVLRSALRSDEGVLDEYLEFKKDQSIMNLEDLKEQKRHEEEFLVANCVDVFEVMDDLTDEQKADALELFKCDLNRKLFIKTKNPNV
jgi:hypothetical protein